MNTGYFQEKVQTIWSGLFQNCLLIQAHHSSCLLEMGAGVGELLSKATSIQFLGKGELLPAHIHVHLHRGSGCFWIWLHIHGTQLMLQRFYKGLGGKSLSTLNVAKFAFSCASAPKHLLNILGGQYVSEIWLIVSSNESGVITYGLVIINICIWKGGDSFEGNRKWSCGTSRSVELGREM